MGSQWQSPTPDPCVPWTPLGTYSDDYPVSLAEGTGLALCLHLQAWLPVEKDKKQPCRQHGASVAQGHPPRLGLVARDLLEERRSPLQGSLFIK